MATEAAFERDSLVMVTTTVRTEPTSKAATELYDVRHRMGTCVTMVNSFTHSSRFLFSLVSFCMDTRTSDFRVGYRAALLFITVSPYLVKFLASTIVHVLYNRKQCLH